jgi:serine/threonine protein kinase
MDSSIDHKRASHRASITRVDSSIYNKRASILNRRVKASDLAQRSSEIFYNTHGDSALDSVAPFERDEIIIGRRVGAGSFSRVYEIKAFHLRADQSDIYTKNQIWAREKIAQSVNNGARYVMKCLMDELEDAADEELFLDAAEDIVYEAEMLGALSHPNIIKLHGVVASRHDAFLDGPSAFFIILEKLESTLADRIESWKEQKQNSRNISKSLKSFGNQLLRTGSTFSVDEVSSLSSRLNVAACLAEVIEYLHSQQIIYHDLKPKNVGFDSEGKLKLFDFGLARFMPRRGDPYKELYELGGVGTPRYSSAEVNLDRPYNLKADVYSFAVVLWEIMSLKKPFAKYKNKKGFEMVVLKADQILVVNQRLPKPIRNIIRESLSRDIATRPTMSEVCRALHECASMGVESCDFDKMSIGTGMSTLSLTTANSICIYR